MKRQIVEEGNKPTKLCIFNSFLYSAYIVCMYMLCCMYQGLRSILWISWKARATLSNSILEEMDLEQSIN